MVELATLQAVSYIMGSLGVFVAAIYYIVNMRAQRKTQELVLKSQEQTLETRQAQLLMDIYKMASEKEYFIAWNAYENRLEKSVDELKLLHKSDPEFRWNVTIWVWYFEGLGVLVREGLLDIRLIALLMTGLIKQWWEWWGPVAKELSVEWNWPRYVIETEYLYNELMKYLEKHPELRA